MIWGVEESLGSPSNHGKMGIVWFGLWPVWGGAMIWLRPWGVWLEASSTFVQTTNEGNAKKIAVLLSSSGGSGSGNNNNSSNKSNSLKIQKPNKARSVFGCLLFWFFIINFLVTFVLVVRCSDRGCCKDDEATLLNCTQNGFPS